MRLGAISVTPIVDGQITGAPATGFPDKSEADWDPYRHYIVDGKLVSQTGGFLVRTGDRVVLVDAGGGPPGKVAPAGDQLGEHLTAMFRQKGLSGDQLDGAVALALTTKLDTGRLPGSLAGAGVAPEDVTDVVFTHLHSDHVGWASAHGKAYFPNATYRCSQADLDYFLGPDVDEAFSMLVWGTLSARDRLAPAFGQLQTWDADSAIAPGIDVRLAPGHTPGSSVVVLSSGSERALVLGDMVHCPVELQDDEWQCIGDVDPALAKRTREIYVRELEGGDVVGAGSHFPGLRFGRLLPAEGARTRGWTFT